MKRGLLLAAALALAGCTRHNHVTEGVVTANFAGTYKASGTTLKLAQAADGGLTGEWIDSQSFGFSGQAYGGNFSGSASNSSCADAIVITAVQESVDSFFLTQVSGCGRKPLEQSFYRQ